MGNGIPILGTVTHKCKIEKISDKVFKIILTQGLNRQIRRMCEYLGYKVTKLKRTRIMNVELGNLKTGEWRELSSEEMKKINSLVKNSSKTEEASLVKPKSTQKTQVRKKSTHQNKSFNSKFGRKRSNK